MPCKAAGVASKNFAKIGYSILQIFFVVISLFLMFNSSKIKWIATDEMMTCPPEMGLNEELCLGTSLMLRMSFSLFILHLLIFIVTLGRN
jgi:hypothetical protein